MKQEVVRVWKQLPMEDMRKHLLNVGQAHGDCENCKELGLDYTSVVKCPSCGIIFKYITSREATNNSEGRHAIAKRLLKMREDLVFIDYDDYKKAFGRDTAKSIFSD